MQYIIENSNFNVSPNKLHKTLTIINPIKIGDLVNVTDYGERYSSYTDAFKFFWGGDKCYGYSYNNEPSKKKLWKVMGLARHGYGNKILAYIQDREFNKLVINLDALKLFKQIGKQKEYFLTLKTIK